MLNFRMRVLAGLAVLASCLAFSESAAAVAPPHSSTLTYQRMSVNGDYFLTYDGERNGRPSRRDWPVTMIFYDDASVNRVKSFYTDRGFVNRGGTMYEGYRARNGSSYRPTRYDSDKGKKTECDANAQDKHFRVYGGGFDRFQDPRYGNFVVATTHIDSGEGTTPSSPCFGEEYFGYSEFVEEFMADVARTSYTVREDYKQLYNYESLYLDANGSDHHWWQNSGYATTVKMP